VQKSDVNPSVIRTKSKRKLAHALPLIRIQSWGEQLVVVSGAFVAAFLSKGETMHIRGMIVLAVWLIVTGLAQALGLTFNGMHIILGVLAIIAGVLLIMNKG
jgi:hypothetical protein